MTCSGGIDLKAVGIFYELWMPIFIEALKGLMDDFSDTSFAERKKLEVEVKGGMVAI